MYPLKEPIEEVSYLGYPSAASELAHASDDKFHTGDYVSSQSGFDAGRDSFGSSLPDYKATLPEPACSRRGRSAE
jgi:hypothetical protein